MGMEKEKRGCVRGIMVRGMMGSGIILRGIFRIPLTIIPLTSFLAMIDFDWPNASRPMARSPRPKWRMWSPCACPPEAYRHKRVLVIVPDGTRTAPIGLVFKALHAHLGGVTDKLDVLIALGTHQPMSEAAICQRLEISLEERAGTYRKVAFHNHAWDQPAALREIGSIPAAEISQLTGGLFAMDVPVEINRLVFEYDQSSLSGRCFRMKWSVFPAATNTFFRA
jgi:hypothetical protein